MKRLAIGLLLLLQSAAVAQIAPLATCGVGVTGAATLVFELALPAVVEVTVTVASYVSIVEPRELHRGVWQTVNFTVNLYDLGLEPGWYMTIVSVKGCGAVGWRFVVAEDGIIFPQDIMVRGEACEIQLRDIEKSEMP